MSDGQIEEIEKEISSLHLSKDDKPPKNFNTQEQKTHLLLVVTRVWYCSCCFYAVLLLLKGFCPYFKLGDAFIHEVFAFICASGIMNGLISSYFKNKI